MNTLLRALALAAMTAAATPALADTTAFTLSPSWQKIASSGASVMVSASSTAVITTSTGMPSGGGFNVSNPTPVCLTLAQDLYAIGSGGVTVTTGVTCAGAGSGGGGGGSAPDQTGSNASDGQATSTTNQHALTFNMIWNGTAWDRWKGVAGIGSVADALSEAALGTPADTAYTGSGGATNIAALKGIYAAVTAPQQRIISSPLGSSTTAANSVAVTFGSGTTLPAFASTPSFNLGTLNGAATAANQTAVQSAAGTSAGTAEGVQGVAGGVAVPVSGTFWQTTQPVSAASLPLPSNAATAANQNVTAAGTSAANAQGMQGVTGGVAMPTLITGTLPAFASVPAFNLDLGGAANALANPIFAQIIGSNGGAILTDSSNRLLVVGPQAEGATATSAPLRAAGWDGTNLRTLRTDGLGDITPVRTTSTVTAGTTSATPNTFTTVLTANASRFGCNVVNTSTAVEYVYVGGGTAAVNASYPIAASGGVFNCASPAHVVITDLLSITSGTASQTYVVVSQ